MDNWQTHLWRIFLLRLFDIERSTVNVYNTFWWQSRWKETKTRIELLIFGGLPSLLLASLFTLLLQKLHSFTDARTKLFRLLMHTEDQQLFNNLPGLQSQIGTTGTSTFMDWASTEFFTFLLWIWHCWTTENVPCKSI